MTELVAVLGTGAVGSARWRPPRARGRPSSRWALTGGEGPEVVIEAVGHPDTFVAAVAEVAVAGRVVFIGYAKAPVTFDTTQFVRKELDVLGSRNATADDALRAWDAEPSAVTRIHVEID